MRLLSCLAFLLGMTLAVRADALVTWRGTITTDEGLSGSLRIGGLLRAGAIATGRMRCRGPGCPTRSGFYTQAIGFFPAPSWTLSGALEFVDRSPDGQRTIISCAFVEVVPRHPCRVRGRYACSVHRQPTAASGTVELVKRHGRCLR